MGMLVLDDWFACGGSVGDDINNNQPSRID